MKYLMTIIMSAVLCVAATARPHCKGFNNYDDKVTVVFTDDNAGDRYTVSDVKLILSWIGKEYKATAVRTTVKDGVATVTLIFPHITHFSNPKVTLRINGKKRTFRVCQ